MVNSRARALGIRLVVVDLAGTTVDYGSRAPAGVFVKVFEEAGVSVTLDEARGPMGMHKRAHIETMLSDPEIAARWVSAHGRRHTQKDIDALYERFVPLQLACLPEYSDLIPGTLDTLRWLEGRGIPVAATTGYSREMTDVVLRRAADQGFAPTVSVCGSEVTAGRPAPWMIFRSMEATGVFPPSSVAVVGDTIPDIESGRNAGAFVVGVTKTGNMLGLAEAEVNALPRAELECRLAKAEAALFEAGADAVMESIAELPQLLDSMPSCR